MPTYQASFTGRQVGAIGILYKINTTVSGKNKEAANLKLYDRYEHITGLTLTPIKKTSRERKMEAPARFPELFNGRW